MNNLNPASRFAVIGYGSWATTIVGKLSRNGHLVRWFISNEDVREGVLTEGFNPKYVSDMEIDRNMVKVSEDIDEVVSDSDIVILGIPSAYLQSVLDTLTVSLEDKFVVSAVKGIIPGANKTVLEYVHGRFGISFKSLGLISGPSHAEEVSRGRLSFLTVACVSEENAALIASALGSESLRVGISDDIYGIEYAAILKNIYAIAAGLAFGLGYGDNFLAVLISRCAAEMKKFLDSSYPFERDIDQSAYLGDLLVTCYSPFSRNRQLGALIGRGCSVDMALSEMTMVAEGYYAAKGIHELDGRYGIEMPFAETVYKVLYGNARARKAMASLAKRL